MPRIIRIINRLNLGGPTYNVAYLTAGLAPEYETMLVAGMKDDSEESSEFILESMGIKPVYIRNMQREINLRNDREAYRQIHELIRTFKPDIVHTHAAKAGTLGRLAAAQLKVPVILHTFHGHVFHSYFGPVKTRLFIEIERYLARKSSAIVAISEDQKNDLAEVYKICKADKIQVVPLGFDLDRFSQHMDQKRAVSRKQYQLDDDTLAIGIIGRLVPVKNHAYFIKVWQQLLKATRQKVHAFIIGDGEERAHIEHMCREAGILFNTPEQTQAGASLTFTSWIHDIDRALAGLDIIALTSLNEGTPVSLIEAQAAGKPIVTTAVGGIGNIVNENKSAFLADPQDPDEFARKLIQLTESAALRAEFAQNGPPFASQRFHYHRLVDDMSQLYQRLLQKA